MISTLTSVFSSKSKGNRAMEKEDSLEDESASLTRNGNGSSSNSSRSSKDSTSSKCRSSRFCDKSHLQSVKTHRCNVECMERYPIHHAARLGKFEQLKRLLDDPNCPRCPMEPDECLGRTPLHYACATGNVEKGLVCMKILIESRQIMSYPNPAEKIKGYVNHLDHQRKSALHLAAENEATSIVVELLTNQANFDISSMDGTCALKEIYKNTPDAMEEALNQSISYVENCTRQRYEHEDLSDSSDFDFTKTCVNVCLDFYPVIGSKMLTDSVEDLEEKDEEAQLKENFNVKTDLSPETGFLYRVNRKRLRTKVRRQILTNVLVQSFLYFKWQKIKWFCFIAIFYHIFWLSLYISTVINVFVLTCPHGTVGISTDESLLQNESANNESETISPNSNLFAEGPLCNLSLYTQCTAGLLLVLSVTVSIKEFFQFVRLGTLYLRFENIGQCILLGFIYMTVPSIYFNSMVISAPLHYQVAAFGIFLAWTLFLCQLAKLPRLTVRINMFGQRGMIVFPDHGIYVEILSRVFKNFLIFISIFSSLLISFVFSFNILLPNSTGFVNLDNAMVKVLTMMTGELNYDDIFHSEDSNLVYPVSSHVMYAIFIMVATIILFNLLIGFTVSDIQGLQKDAEINQISNKLEQIFLMECFLLSGAMQRLARFYSKVFLGGKVELLNSIMVVKTTFSKSLCYHTKIKVIPFHLRVRLRNLASRNCFGISDVCGAVRSRIFQDRRMNYEH